MMRRREAVIQGFGMLSVGQNLPAYARNLPDVMASDLSKTGSIETLIPIVRLKLEIVDALKEFRTQGIGALSKVTSKLPPDEKTFKAIFDAYSDAVSYKQKFVEQNAFLVYYTKGFDGPGRPSIESDLPVKQSLQYGARNDAWVAWDAFLGEVDFATSGETDVEDLIKLLMATVIAIDAYLALAPSADLESARNQIGK
jgi:hypothetical protein